MNSIPWVEKYRPKKWNQLLLSDDNQSFFKTILETGYFPHCMFIGSPGSGKTSTVYQLLERYHELYPPSSCFKTLLKTRCMHFNASDDRGIDVIRNQIAIFMSSNGFSLKTDSEPCRLKFIIFDEIDNMTTYAQTAIHQLLSKCNPYIRLCIICNYQFKIQKNLASHFIHIRFDGYSFHQIHQHLQFINQQEGNSYSDIDLIEIQSMFHDDIRSMINYMQCNCLNSVKFLHQHIIDNFIHNLINLSISDILQQWQSITFSYSITNHEFAMKLIHTISSCHINNHDLQILQDSIINITNNISLQNWIHIFIKFIHK